MSRCIQLLGLVGLLAGSSGCSVWHLAHRTMYSELAEYPQITDGRLACKQYQRWARDEWQQIQQDEGGAGYSADYGSGFVQGFVDQVYAGGAVRPPAMPPRKYWRTGYRNPRGEQAVEDWYGGFRHGARVAKAGGYRHQAEIPSSLRRHSTVDAPDLGDELDATTPLLESSEPPVVPDQPPPVGAEVPDEQLPRLVPDEAEDAEDTAAEPLPAPTEQSVPEPAPSAESEDPPALPTPPAEALQLEAPPEGSEESSLEESSVTEPALRPLRSAAKRPEPQTTPEAETPSSSDATPVEQRDEPEPESSTPDGPPLPPWHRSAKTGNSPSDEDDSASSPPDDGSEFDPFAGTPFRDTLGLTTVRTHQANASPTGRTGGRSAVRDARVQPTSHGARVPVFQHPSSISDPPAGWQQAPAHPASWTRRD